MYPRRVINWHVFQIIKSHFRHTIWLRISKIVITRCTFRRSAREHQNSKQSTEKNMHEN